MLCLHLLDALLHLKHLLFDRFKIGGRGLLAACEARCDEQQDGNKIFQR
jgi:hypothetical protein